ncbi:hypothetical protein BDV29DRAFT_155978 [Aspergillus leporis]|uniref:Uncharacterized protein n=1 Tax=Aspergillus leporis TaxID=41062 RepID=A0A5N5X714_9EURO|nr:hypothetical protein BDV29DRAFT_155978 [Aspergillus leporis]
MDETVYANLDVTTGELSWNLVFQAANPARQGTLFTEIPRLETADDEDAYISRNDMYLATCVMESSRLQPAIPSTIPQPAPTKQVVDGHRITAGTNLVVDPLNVQGEFWAFDNSLYRPERVLSKLAIDLRSSSGDSGLGHGNVLESIKRV